MVYSGKERWKLTYYSYLTPLNAITICNLQEPLLIYLYAEQCLARLIYLGLDLFVGYDHHTLVEESRDYTTFDTPPKHHVPHSAPSRLDRISWYLL